MARLKAALRKRRLAVEACGGAEFFFDAEKLVVLGDAVGTAGGAGLDLAGGGGDGEVGDEGVFGFAGTVGDDGVVAGFAGELDGVDGFGDAANLIEFDENSIGDSFVDAAREALSVGYEEVVADQLNFFLRRFAACLERITRALGAVEDFEPIFSVSFFQPGQSSSPMPSSIDTMGYF